MVAFILTAYNRPQYLRECLRSLSQITTKPDILIIHDDGSTDEETKNLILTYQPPFECTTAFIFNPVNTGIRSALERSIERAASLGANMFINLDGDAVVKPDFIEKLLALKEEHPKSIVSGFNAISEVNPVVAQYDHCCVKAFANGINMCFDKEQYLKYVKPSLAKVGNWDYNTSLLCREDNIPFYVTTPSVIQHIGIVSSMGHTANGVKPDQAHDF